MESFIKSYMFLNTIDGIGRYAKERLFKQLLEKNVRGSDKKLELDDTDQESLICDSFGGKPIPGLMYTFLYKLDEKERKQGFNDVAPIVHCVKIENNIMYGINLNMLPPKVRLAYLEAIYNLYKSFFVSIEETTENDIITLNNKFLNDVMGKKIKPFLEKICSISKENIFFALRQYNYNSITNIRMVEFAEWRYIPFFSPVKSFVNSNLGEIYNLYNKSKLNKK